MNYWLQRIGLAILVLLAVSALMFGAMNVLGDPLFNTGELDQLGDQRRHLAELLDDVDINEILFRPTSQEY